MRIFICDTCGREGNTKGDVLDGWTSEDNVVTCLECRLKEHENKFDKIYAILGAKE